MQQATRPCIMAAQAAGSLPGAWLAGTGPTPTSPSQPQLLPPAAFAAGACGRRCARSSWSETPQMAASAPGAPAGCHHCARQNVQCLRHCQTLPPRLHARCLEWQACSCCAAGSQLGRLLLAPHVHAPPAAAPPAAAGGLHPILCHRRFEAFPAPPRCCLGLGVASESHVALQAAVLHLRRRYCCCLQALACAWRCLQMSSRCTGLHASQPQIPQMAAPASPSRPSCRGWCRQVSLLAGRCQAASPALEGCSAEASLAQGVTQEGPRPLEGQSILQPLRPARAGACLGWSWGLCCCQRGWRG